MEIMEKAIPYLTGVVLGAGVVFLNVYKSRPNSAYLIDINKDSKSDIVVRNKNEGNFVFIQQKDGNYILLHNLQEEQKKSIEEKVKELK